MGRELGSDSRAILLTVCDQDDDIFDGLRAGARGYLLKNAGAEELVDAVRTVNGGGSLLQPMIATRLIERMDAEPSETLTKRETQVLQLISSGAQNKKIAETLSLSVNTVKFHIENIYGKLGVGTRTQAARVGRERGLVDS